MALRKGGGEGIGSGKSANLQTIILGAITIVLAIIMLGIAVDVISPYLTVEHRRSTGAGILVVSPC